MPFLNDSVLDAALAAVQAGTRIDICSAEPATYAAATSTLSLGNKTSITVGAIGDRSPNGRKVTVPAIVSGSPGSVTASGTASHWALSNPGASTLLAAGALSASQAVVNGNTFTLAAFDIGIPDAV